MEEKYAIWLAERVAPATRTMDTLLKTFGSCDAVYEADKSDYIAAGITGEKVLKRLLDKSLDETDPILDSCDKLGVRVIPYGSEEYPLRLLNIYSPPAVLYAEGERLEVDGKPLITVVGTRYCTEYGRKAAYHIADKLARRGVTVVSGLAIGIDAYALSGAVKADGCTVGVIGCGHGKNYPAENYGLRRAMLKRGTVISEYAPRSPISKGNFPIRNRIMAGISLGVLVVEAPERSGSLITAKYSLEYGRDVFAVPGNINSYESKGSNALIKDGAVAVTDVDDIIREYLQLFPDLAKKPRTEQKPKADLDGLSENEKKVVSVLGEEPVDFATILEKTGLNVSQVLSALTKLQVRGICKAHPMQQFSL